MNGARVERRGYCQVCHRALKNPKSVELGVGPFCARTQGATFRGEAPPDLFSRRAHYDVVRVADGFVAIADRSEQRGGVSVTNDADNVVRELFNAYGARRVIYRDSMGRWDELAHDGAGAFSGFKPVPACFSMELEA